MLFAYCASLDKDPKKGGYKDQGVLKNATARNVRLHSIPSAPPLVRCSFISLRSHTGPVLLRLFMNDDAPGFVISFLAGSCPLPLLAPCFASCSSLYPIHTMTLSDSRPHDDPLMRVVIGARSGRCGRVFIRSLVAFEAITIPSILTAPKGIQHGIIPNYDYL